MNDKKIQSIIDDLSEEVARQRAELTILRRIVELQHKTIDSLSLDALMLRITREKL